MELEEPTNHGWDLNGNPVWYGEPYPDDVAELLLNNCTDEIEDTVYDENDHDVGEYYED